jgi:hypothetical protein
MKTVITQQIDGYNIIIGFDKPQIDPIETKKAIQPLINNLNISKKLKQKIKEAGRIHKAKSAALLKMKFAEKQKDAIKFEEAERELNKRLNDLKEIEKDFIELKKEQLEKIQALKKNNRVYFEPRTGEDRITKNEYQTLSAAYIDNKQNGNLTDRNGNEVIDNRGQTYVKEGQIIHITTIGHEVDGPLVSNLTPAALARLIYEYMTIPEIEAEKQEKANNILSQAAVMRSELEIQGDPDALTKSQTWYNDQITALNSEYDTILANREADRIAHGLENTPSITP